MGKQSREKREKREAMIPKKGEKFEFLSSPEKVYLFIVRWGTYLVLFTPLIINTKFFFPFVAPKTIFFRIIIEIILLAYIFLVMTNKSWRPQINALTIALVVFLGIFILASFTGVNLERSFWSTNERMTGILTMLHLFAFFIILSSCFRERKDWEKFLGISVIVGVILSSYVLMGNEISTRGGGTIGNTSFMAAYLLFDIFFALILFLSKRGGWQIFAGISLIPMLWVLLTSTARGAIFSFFIGLSLLYLSYLIFSQKKALKKLAIGIVLVLIIFGIVSAVFQPPIIKDKIDTTLTEMESRLVVWENSWQGFKERPILGWGPENFNVVFLKYFNPCMSLPECGTEIWFDRVHNIIFDTLVATGIVGLLSYLAIFGIAIYGLLRAAVKVTERRNIFIPLGLVALLIVYFVQNLLVFDMINTYLVFFLSLAFINFLIQKQVIEEKKTRRKVNPALAFVIIAVMIFVLWTTNIEPLRANHYIIKTIGSQNVEECSLFFQKSLNTWMEKYEPREHFGQKMVQSIYQSIPEENREAFQKAFDLAEIEMEKSIRQNSLDFRHYLFLGELYNSSYRFSGDKEKLERSEQVLEKAIQLSPTNQQGYWQLAEAKIAQGKTEEAILLLQKTIELEPRVARSHWYLAMTYRIAGEYRLALEEAFKAEETGYSLITQAEELEKIDEIYFALVAQDPEALIDYDTKLANLDLKILKKDPDNYTSWFRLAASYANLNRFEEAREAALRAKEINPNLQLKVENFLKTLPEE